MAGKKRRLLAGSEMPCLTFIAISSTASFPLQLMRIRIPSGLLLKYTGFELSESFAWRTVLFSAFGKKCHALEWCRSAPMSTRRQLVLPVPSGPTMREREEEPGAKPNICRRQERTAIL